MGSKHLKPTLLLLAAVLWANFATAQTTASYLKEVLILNGGQFGNPQQQANLIGLNPYNGATRHSDTIHMNSVQDLLVDGDFAFIAAQDSIVKLRLSDFSRVASAGFPGPSTNVLAVYQNQLLVGNFYGQTDSNLYVFNKNTLALEHIVGGIHEGVKGIAVIGDTAYLSQNLTTASYLDSAGYLALVHLPTGTFVKNVPGNNVADIGRLFPYKGGLVGFGSSDDAVSLYLPFTGALQQAPLGVDLQTNYGSTLQVVDDTLFGIFDGKIGSLNLFDLSIIDAEIVDTLITAFQYDVVGQQFYVTQTDYFSYTRGMVFNKAGTAVDTFVTGYAPEVLALWQGVNHAPVAVNDITNAVGGAAINIYPLDNDTDPDGDSLILSIVTTTVHGTSTLNGPEIIYTANAGYHGLDTLVYQVCDVSQASLCSQARVVFNVTTVGIDDVNAYQVTVFPNPVTDKLTIRISGLESQTLYLTDLTGRTLKTIEVNSTATIDLHELATGIYLLRGVGFAQKVVKQ